MEWQFELGEQNYALQLFHSDLTVVLIIGKLLVIMWHLIELSQNQPLKYLIARWSYHD